MHGVSEIVDSVILLLSYELFWKLLSTNLENFNAIALTKSSGMMYHLFSVD